MPWTYLLRCSDGSFYAGSTKDLDVRFAQHQSGAGAINTKRRLPVELVWAGEFDRVDEAFTFEKQLQGWSRAKRIALIEGRFDELPALARCRTQLRRIQRREEGG